MDRPDAMKLRALPQVQSLLETGGAKVLAASHGQRAVAAALRDVLGDARRGILQGGVAPAPAVFVERAAELLRAAPRLTRVINATGIVLHTNLGRAPLAAEAISAVVQAAGYCALEYDVARGGRGSRMQGLAPLLCAVTGAEAALAVNNNAAAMLLAMTGLAGMGPAGIGSAMTGLAGIGPATCGEVIVSRGELIEIGGGFRIPDVIRQGGARLVEVGTTNKTRLADYREAITPATRVLLKVHPSNFRMVGFTQAVAREELVALARTHDLLVVEDLGSGALSDVRVGGGQSGGAVAEDTVQLAVAAGIDVVAFSADKLLGGPQAGVLVGREAAIARLRGHPLMRALRLDKMSLAALEATLRLHREGLVARIPALRMLGQDVAEVRARAERLAGLVAPYGRVQACSGEAGGGTLPAQSVASAAVALGVDGMAADVLVGRLRTGAPAVIGRIVQGEVLLDMLTVADSEVAEIAAAVHAAMGTSGLAR